MTESHKSRREHRVFLVNETNKSPFATPEILAVEPGDEVLFVVVGEKDTFMVSPETDVFRSIDASEEVPVRFGSPPKVTVRRDAEPNSVHRYEVYSQTAGSIDPILIVHE